MTTEILGFIIIAGAIIVLLARQHLNKAEDDPEVLEAATGRLRYELEQTADEIISRMTEHVNQLEKMLQEADYKIQVLQQKIDYLEALQAGGQPLPTSGQMRLQPQTISKPKAQDSQSTFRPQRDMASTKAEGNSAMKLSTSDERAWELIREASMKLEEQYEAQSNTMQSVQQADSLQQAISLQNGNIDNLVSGYSTNSLEAVQQDNSDDRRAADGQGLDTEAATSQARKMLSQGYELEEIAKATGLGKGALHLIRQLQTRK